MSKNLILGLVCVGLCCVVFLARAETSEATLAVKQMSCATCPVVVKAALYDLDGVEDVSVSMEEKTALVKYDDSLLDPAQLAEAVTNSGFPAEVSE